MKAIIGTLTVLVLMIGALVFPMEKQQSALASYAAQLGTAPHAKDWHADILSGLAHGKADGKDNCYHPDGCHWWILMRGNGFINQTQEFIKGYVHGFCSDPENAGGGGSDAEQADITCDEGPNGARWATPGSLDSNNTTFWSPN